MSFEDILAHKLYRKYCKDEAVAFLTHYSSIKSSQVNAKDQIKWMDTFTGKMKEICLRKGDDYANDDRLSNFKKVGAMVNQDAQMAILVLMATKVARLSELLTGNKVPNNESIEDSFLDLANYAALGYMLHKEKIGEALRELAAEEQELGLGYINSLADIDKNDCP